MRGVQQVTVYHVPGLDADYIMAEKAGRRGRVPISYVDMK
jgi:hypothetical protein